MKRSPLDWLAVPAGLYFLCVVHGLHIDAIKDWNTVSTVAAEQTLVAGAEAVRAT